MIGFRTAILVQDLYKFLFATIGELNVQRLLLTITASSLKAFSCRGCHVGLTKEHELLACSADCGTGGASLQQGTLKIWTACGVESPPWMA
jgi:hypothetical protein